MIDGKLAKLRSWREDDIIELTKLRNDISLQSQLLSRVRGSNPDQTRQWLQKRSSGPDSLFFIIADINTDCALGYIQFIDIEVVDRTAKLGICLSPENQGKGFGQEVLRLAFTYINDCWAIRKVILEVREDNRQAISCYEKIGFQQCGAYKKHRYFDGEWRDLILMELFLDTLVKIQ